MSLTKFQKISRLKRRLGLGTEESQTAEPAPQQPVQLSPVPVVAADPPPSVSARWSQVNWDRQAPVVPARQSPEQARAPRAVRHRFAAVNWDRRSPQSAVTSATAETSSTTSAGTPSRSVDDFFSSVNW